MALKPLGQVQLILLIRRNSIIASTGWTFRGRPRWGTTGKVGTRCVSDTCGALVRWALGFCKVLPVTVLGIDLFKLWRKLPCMHLLDLPSYLDHFQHFRAVESIHAHLTQR